MKRLVLCLPVAVFLSSCAQLFDGNLYQGIDTPPALSASSLSGKSISDIQAMAGDDSFYEQLKDSPEALDAAQTVLEAGFSGVTTSSTSAEKTSAISSATTYVLVTVDGSSAGGVVSDAVNQLSNLKSGTQTAVQTAVQSLVAGKSEAEITSILTNLVEASNALSAMQTAATSGTSVDSATFFGAADNTGEVAQIALVAAAVNALVTDQKTDMGASATSADAIAALAITLAAGGSPTTTSTTATGNLSSALSSTADPASNPYAYLSAVKSELGV